MEKKKAKGWRVNGEILLTGCARVSTRSLEGISKKKGGGNWGQF